MSQVKRALEPDTMILWLRGASGNGRQTLGSIIQQIKLGVAARTDESKAFLWLLDGVIGLLKGSYRAPLKGFGFDLRQV